MNDRYKLVNLDRPDRLELTLNDFDASDVPKGFGPYNLNVLAKSQQKKLNAFKVETVRENQKYLAAHPEVKAIIALLVRHIFQKFKHFHVHKTIVNFFTQPRTELEDSIANYLDGMGDSSFSEKLKLERRREEMGEQDAALKGQKDIQGDEEIDPEVLNIVRIILSEILDKVSAEKDEIQ